MRAGPGAATLPRYTVRCHTFAPLAAGNAMRVFDLKLRAQKPARVA
jgi:hypothetical protein